MALERRDLLALATGAALSACGAASGGPSNGPAGPATPVAGTSVDVHCHVFNSHDVPVRKFVELVYLDKHPGGNVLDGLLTFICHIMDAEAPTTKEELDELRGVRTLEARRRGRSVAERKAAAVAMAVRRMYDGDTRFDHGVPGNGGPDAAQVQVKRFNPANRAWILRQLPAVRRRRLYSLDMRRDPQAELDAAARDLLARADVRTWIDFAYNYTQARWELTDQLAGLSALQSTEVMLYTPALLDIGRWVGDLHTSDIGEQVEIMRLIAARPGRPYAVHAFIPYDPWRAAGDPHLLDTVKDAIGKQGCIGVKLYPPMGFKPMQNDAATFPPSLQPPHPDAAALVDQHIGALLDYCLDEDVPILAHCSYSQFISRKGGECANPLNWKAFMDFAPRNRDLRLNLAHFGGPWSKNSWSETVVSMLGQYPNLYSDVGDASFVLDPADAANQAIIRRMQGLLGPAQPSAAARSRIMYGSDWSLLAREPDAGGYYAQMKTYFCDKMNFTADERRDFLGRTALKFLGLAKTADGASPKPRQRLEAFRRDNKLDLSLFDRVDAVIA